MGLIRPDIPLHEANRSEPGHKSTSTSAPSKKRAMVPSTIGGRHTWPTKKGNVYIWERDEKKLARFRFDKKLCFETLGPDDLAMNELIRLIAGINEGRYVRKCDRIKPVFAVRNPDGVTLHELVDARLADIKKRKGTATHNDICNRLEKLVQFASLPKNRNRCLFAVYFDRDLAYEFKAYVATLDVTPNGRPGAKPRRISPGYQRLILEAASGLFSWATNKDNRSPCRLSPLFQNPFDREMVGRRPARDPVAKPKLTLADRIRLVSYLDLYGLRLLALPMVMPCRRGEWASTLVASLNEPERRIKFGHLLEDPTKSRSAFTIEYPRQLSVVVSALVANRTSGPLFVKRTMVEAGTLPTTGWAEIQAHLNGLPTEQTLAENDKKAAYRRFVQAVGGVGDDRLSGEFTRACRDAGLDASITFHDLRYSVSRDLKRSNVDRDTRLFLTGRLSDEMLFHYEGVDLTAELGRYFEDVLPLTEAIELRHAQLVGDVAPEGSIIMTESGARLVHTGCTPYDLKD